MGIFKQNVRYCGRNGEFNLIKKYLIFEKIKYNMCIALRGCSSAGLERLPVTQKVEGSSPFNPARNLTVQMDGFLFLMQVLKKIGVSK